MNVAALQIFFKIVELILSILAICFATLSMAIIVRIRLFHWNFNIIAINLIAQFCIHVSAGAYLFLRPLFISAAGLFLYALFYLL
jgi:hypothetical protein